MTFTGYVPCDVFINGLGRVYRGYTNMKFKGMAGASVCFANDVAEIIQKDIDACNSAMKKEVINPLRITIDVTVDGVKKEAVRFVSADIKVVNYL